MKTKDRILEKSIDMFNERGITKVTIRHIAAELRISHGNLAYHFKNKEVIIGEIYTRMADEMATAVYPGGDFSLLYLQTLLEMIRDFQCKYRFFYMDMLEISRKYPAIISRYRETLKVRNAQFQQLIDHFIRKELLKSPPEEGYYLSLFHSIWTVLTFRLNEELILGEHHPYLKSGSAIKKAWEILLPHLTAAGEREYQTLNL